MTLMIIINSYQKLGPRGPEHSVSFVGRRKNNRIRPLLFWLIQLLHPDNTIREDVQKVYCTVRQFVKSSEQIYFIKLVK